MTVVKGIEMKVKNGKVTKTLDDYLYFEMVMYEQAEIERIRALPVWLRYIRIAFVFSLNWLPFQIRDRLGVR